eukprot:CAMPEP_0115483208 /NCGR_PEP_ID=MMETSP0271-20121206/58736_1 /TAXON_ID=71861 /ORGANISM="Scrippsiella trochoidea, Strain CCMP3099" /LENGTH=561 /DNA_ID=CAMNT_0002911049 /DNA_START=200 /DNA_END=1885 /DNA_ORIENTATION=-
MGQRLFEHGNRQMDMRTMAFLAVGLLSITAPLELSQLTFAVFGAFAYAVIQAFQVPTTPPKKASCSYEPRSFSKDPAACQPCDREHHERPAAAWAKRPLHLSSAAGPRSGGGRAGLTPGGVAESRKASQSVELRRDAVKEDFRQPSTQPIERPCFKATDWEGEIQELLTQISPSAQGDKAVAKLANAVQKSLSQLIPEIEVVGFASSDPARGTAFGVAVPEVDIVARASPQVLVSRVQDRTAFRGANTKGLANQPNKVPQLDAKKLQKSAIRFCTNHLVGNGSFKFRRSAFKSLEPKVTLLAAPTLGVSSASIPIDFSVNSSTPLYNAALMTECGQLEPRAKSLILIVRRWAKDRGICHAAKGHLAPYAWTLLVVYFMQVGASEGPFLPPLEDFVASPGSPGPQQKAASAAASTGGTGKAAEKPRNGRRQWSPPAGGAHVQVGTLFKEFIHFFAKEFNFQNEAVNVRAGTRGPPPATLPLNVLLQEDGTSQVSPCIEDPFEPTRNMSECSSVASLARFREELERAEELCGRSGPLCELLEPWVPREKNEDELQELTALINN